MRCMVMRLTEKESLDYFNEQGYDISCRQFYRIKKTYGSLDSKDYLK
jgi:hypothetical protein